MTLNSLHFMWLKLAILAVMEAALIALLCLLIYSHVGPVFYHSAADYETLVKNCFSYLEVDLVWIGVVVLLPWQTYRTIRTFRQ